MSQKGQKPGGKKPAGMKAGRGGAAQDSAGGKKAKQQEAAEPAQSLGAWTREQIEAVVVAIILALLIRHFAVEAFKIPTGSMQPTLHGSERGGDRILVFKPSYMVDEPERWDIIVFKYPLNCTVNYIKRLVGLPGEQLLIKDGDIHIDGKIAQKPRRVQQSLWERWPVYPRFGADDPVEQYFKQEPAGAFTRDGKDLVCEASAECSLQYPQSIELGATARTGDPMIRGGRQGGSAIVGDVLLRYKVQMESEGTQVFAEIRESDNIYRLEINAGEEARILMSTVDTTRGAQDVGPATEIARSTDRSLRIGKRHTIDFYYVDGAIALDVDGEEWLRSEQQADTARRAQNHVRFGVVRGNARFRDVKMFRDLYHSDSGPSTNVTIPEDKYFVLGDNTLQSKDSRLWFLSSVEHEGQTIWFDADEGDAFDTRSRLTFTDIFGQSHSVIELAGAYRTPQEPSPFVPKEYILGKAFSTFWPPIRDGKRNLKFVH